MELLYWLLMMVGAGALGTIVAGALELLLLLQLLPTPAAEFHPEKAQESLYQPPCQSSYQPDRKLKPHSLKTHRTWMVGGRRLDPGDPG